MGEDTCMDCHRPGQLTTQVVQPVNGKPMVFRFHHCQYHRAWFNRNLTFMPFFRRMEVIDFVDDETLIKKWKENRDAEAKAKDGGREST